MGKLRTLIRSTQLQCKFTHFKIQTWLPNILNLTFSKTIMIETFNEHSVSYRQCVAFGNHIETNPWCLFGRWLLCSVLWFEIFYPHITSHALFAKSFKHLRRKGHRKLEKIYIFLWYKKRDFYFWCEENTSEFQKIC